MIINNMPTRKFSDEMEQRIAEMYQQGMPAEEIARRVGCLHASTILRVLKRGGVTGRGRGYGRTPAMVWRHGDRVRALYESGLSVHEIGREIGSADSVVKRILAGVGIQSEPRRRTRSRHVNWNGGRYVNDRGYVEVICDDPRFASMRGSDGYTPEHRLVIAQALGRPLKRHESVHHIDGNRQKNALANLELRQGKHGHGVRLRCRVCGSHDVEAVSLGVKE